MELTKESELQEKVYWQEGQGKREEEEEEDEDLKEEKNRVRQNCNHRVGD